jgi:tRNA(Glu) U13 pseudouridine synthase TruD
MVESQLKLLKENNDEMEEEKKNSFLYTTLVCCGVERGNFEPFAQYAPDSMGCMYISATSSLIANKYQSEMLEKN